VSASKPAQQRRRPGRPPSSSRELVVRVASLKNQGLSYRAISDALNTEGVLTPDGRPRWQRSYVDRLLHTQHATDILKEIDMKPTPGTAR
jgi:intein-encoded DNA endonuclease-like protein